MTGYEFTHKGTPLKKGSRLQVLGVAGGMFLPSSYRAKMTVAVTGVTYQDNVVTAVKLKGRRTPVSLEHRLTKPEDGCLMLAGWQDDVQVDSESRTGWTADGKLNLWTPDDLSADEVIRRIQDRLVFCNLRRNLKARLYSHDKLASVDLTAALSTIPFHVIPGFPTGQPSLSADPLTEAQKDRLVQEEERLSALRDQGEQAEHGAPMFKLFKTGTACTWLVYSMEQDRDTMWVVADLGLDCVEFGTASLQELRQVIPGTGQLERDKFFDPDKMAYSLGDLIRLDRMPSNLYEK